MATTTKILATASRYGNAGNASYTNSGYLYVGTNDNNSDYRARITFPSLRSIAAIGDTNIVITKVTLTVRRDSGYKASTVIVGPSSDSSWGAVRDGTASLDIPAKTAWYTFDITHCAEVILNYSNNWYIHMTCSGSQTRFNGVGSESTAPYITVVWEYAASTITTGVESTELGTPVTFTITQEEGYSSYSLSYEFGDETGTIAETSDTSITWTPPLQFASEIPNSETGEVKVTMRVYDASGNQIRTEILYLMVTVPDSIKIKFQNGMINIVGKNGLVYDNGAVALLCGKSSIAITPIIDIADAYGANVVSLTASIDNEGLMQTLSWDSLTETDAGIFAGNTIDSSIFSNVGSVNISVTAMDSRGREVSIEGSFTVHEYMNPVITQFDISRYEPLYNEDEAIVGYVESDTGENVWVTLRANCSDIVIDGESKNFMSWKITATDSDGIVNEYTGDANSTSINLVEDRIVITNIVSSSLTVQYTVELIDTAGYTTYQYDTVTPGRANFALAASKYGASFGCLPKGTEENPMLESAYPIFAYGGIDGVTKARRTVLWTNPNPTAAIPDSGLQMNLASDDYDELVMFYKPGTTSTYMLTQSTLKGYGFHLVNMVYPSEGPTVVYRTAPRTSDTLYTVTGSASGFCNSKNLFNPGWAIPYQIIGIKYTD